MRLCVYLFNSLLHHYCKCYNFTIKPLLQVREELILCTAVISSVCCISTPVPASAGTLAAFFPKSFAFLLFYSFIFNNVNNNRRSLRLHPMQRHFWGPISPRLGNIPHSISLVKEQFGSLGPCCIFGSEQAAKAARATRGAAPRGCVRGSEFGQSEPLPLQKGIGDGGGLPGVGGWGCAGGVAVGSGALLGVQPGALIQQATREHQGAGFWSPNNVCVTESLVRLVTPFLR